MGRQSPIRVGIGLAAFVLGACAKDTLNSIATVTDEFVQNSASEVDILWVVDNSESMTEEQNGLGLSFQAFISNLIASRVDYQIGVVSTDTADGGRLHTGASAVPFIHPDTPDPEAKFLENVRVGINGSRSEKGFESAALALGKGAGWAPGDPINDPNNGTFRPGRCNGTTCEASGRSCTSDAQCAQSFLRPEAALFIIMVSDEDDSSFGPVTYYRRLFDGYKGPGNESRVSVSAIVGPPGNDGGCFAPSRGSANPGDRYVDLAGQTGGIWSSICAEFSDSLRELSITAAGLKSIFELSSQATPGASIPCGDTTSEGFCVRIDGSILPAQGGVGWTYDPGRNAIVFGVRNLPRPQSKITVEYQRVP